MTLTELQERAIAKMGERSSAKRFARLRKSVWHWYSANARLLGYTAEQVSASWRDTVDILELRRNSGGDHE